MKSPSKLGNNEEIAVNENVEKGSKRNIFKSPSKSGIYVYMYTYEYVCMYVFMYITFYVCMFLCTYRHIYI
jgi:hypothetical protein